MITRKRFEVIWDRLHNSIQKEYAKSEIDVETRNVAVLSDILNHARGELKKDMVFHNHLEQ